MTRPKEKSRISVAGPGRHPEALEAGAQAFGLPPPVYFPGAVPGSPPPPPPLPPPPPQAGNRPISTSSGSNKKRKGFLFLGVGRLQPVKISKPGRNKAERANPTFLSNFAEVGIGALVAMVRVIGVSPLPEF